MTVALTAATYGALCTYTNAKQTRIATAKTVLPAADTATFNLSATTNLGSATAVDQASGGSTACVQSTVNTALTVTETSGSNSTMTEYVSAVLCTNQDTSATVATTSTSLSGTTRPATLTPAPYVDNLCRFKNTRSENLSVSKSNGLSSLVAGSTNT